ncbi:molybdenum cofactor guanylyltransferase [Microbacterium sp. PMB16]|uniref:molybdenum cofactor guanylyltransferase n=1 Tax=Microbacterium sp. PMB16 TaxID=3120157 RepID=UPI003F4B85D1
MTDRADAAAIVLAGGRASRLGGVDKPQLAVGGSTLLDRAVRAVSWCESIVVVGPRAAVDAGRAGSRIVWTRETPAFGGPVAAIAAGLALIGSDEVCIVSADTPRAEEAVALLREHPSRDADGVCLTDPGGRVQWLIGRYRTAPLRAALAALPDSGRDASIRALVSGLRLDVVSGGDLAVDVDTWDDLERARARALSTRAQSSRTQSAPSARPDEQETK